MTSHMTTLSEVAPRRPAAGPPRVRVRQSWNRRLHWVATHAIGLALGVAFTLPMLFVLLTAVMKKDQAMSTSLWPTEWHFENFVQVFERARCWSTSPTA
jgi:multiple sugar transport system permease protein